MSKTPDGMTFSIIATCDNCGEEYSMYSDNLPKAIEFAMNVSIMFECHVTVTDRITKRVYAHIYRGNWQ